MIDRQLEKLKRIKTPYVIYELENVRKQYHELKESISKAHSNFIIAYAYKTNPHLGKALANLGSSFFVTSFAHLNAVRKFSSNLVIFNHPAYSKEEMKKLFKEKNVLIVIESISQLDLANNVCKELETKSEVLLRVDTGARSKSTPFKPRYNLGVPLAEVDKVFSASKKYENIRIKGIHNHFASQNTDLKSWAENIDRLKKIFNKYEDLEILNLGGGWPIEYEFGSPQISDVANLIGKSISTIKTNKKDFKLIVEPGRVLVGPSGKLYTKVLDIRERDVFELIVDASLLTSFGDRLFYGLSLNTKSKNLTSNRKLKKYRVIGNSSVSIDDFGEIKLSEAKIGDLIMFSQAGAYFTAINTSFTGVPRPKEYLYSKGRLTELAS